MLRTGIWADHFNLIFESFKSLVQMCCATAIAFALLKMINLVCIYADKRLSPSNLPPVYVINLDRSPKRLQNIDRSLRAIGVEYQRFSAIDWKEILASSNENFENEIPLAEFINNNSVPQYFFVRCNKYPNAKLKFQKKYLTPGEIGCFFSHATLWEQCRRKGLDKIIVLEDDVSLKPFFRTKLSRFLRELPQDFDFAALGYKNSYPLTKINLSGNMISAKDAYECCTYAYLINLASDSTLNIVRNFYHEFPIDWVIWILCELNQYHGYVVGKTMAVSDYHFGTEIGIGRAREWSADDVYNFSEKLSTYLKTDDYNKSDAI